MSLATFAFVLAAQWAIAAGCFPVLTWPRIPRIVAWAAAGAAVAMLPALLPATSLPLRFVAATSAVWVLTQLYDLHVGAGLGHRPDWPTFLRYLPSPFWLVCRLPPPVRPADSRNLTALIRRACGVLAGLALCRAVFHFDWRHVPFAAEHVVKVLATYATLATVAGMLSSVFRLLGQPVLEGLDRPWLAHSPADFWRRRWNRPAQRFFHEDVFLPARGRGSPGRAMLATFVVSAVAHEFLFALALGRVQGYQLAFFLIQGFATIATRQWPRTPPRILATFAFNLATSVLFFASLATVFPSFYSNGLPAWLHALDLSP